jgi:hypothetical protein
VIKHVFKADSDVLSSVIKETFIAAIHVFKADSDVLSSVIIHVFKADSDVLSFVIKHVFKADSDVLSFIINETFIDAMHAFVVFICVCGSLVKLET